MKITKISQDGGIPAGFVRIMIDAGENDQRTEIIGHGPGTSCETQNDDLLLEDLLAIEVEGFGETEVDAGGLTSEGYEAKRKSKPKVVNPLTQKPSQTKAPFGGPFGTQEDTGRELDLGYGV